MRDEDDANVSGLVAAPAVKSAFALGRPADNAPALGALAGAAPRAFAQGGAATNLTTRPTPLGLRSPPLAATDWLVLVAWSLDRASAAVERALAERVPPAGCGFCAGLGPRDRGGGAAAARRRTTTAPATAAAARAAAGASPAPVPSAVACARLAAFALGYAPRAPRAAPS